MLATLVRLMVLVLEVLRVIYTTEHVNMDRQRCLETIFTQVFNEM